MDKQESKNNDKSQQRRKKVNQVKYENKKDGASLKKIPAQTFKMGNAQPHHGFESDNEGPEAEVSIPEFYLSETTVTNQMFHKFVLETGYITEAERIGTSYVFQGLVKEENRDQVNVQPTPMTWWLDIQEANWRKPEGPGSTISDRMDHPVVHVTWNDAMAYCRWAGGRLPTEAEWEAAARGGYESLEYQWGNELHPDGEHLANLWQGEFPHTNTVEDGYKGTAPADAFFVNDYGVRQMTGNVWEWCLNPSRIPLTSFTDKTAQDFLEELTDHEVENKATRGGSFLCHGSYCTRYRVAARNGNSAESASSNIGFRYVRMNEETEHNF